MCNPVGALLAAPWLFVNPVLALGSFVVLSSFSLQVLVSTFHLSVHDLLLHILLTELQDAQLLRLSPLPNAR